jgi:hypothetical protein
MASRREIYDQVGAVASVGDELGIHLIAAQGPATRFVV